MRLSGIKRAAKIGVSAPEQAPANDAGMSGRALIALTPVPNHEPRPAFRDASFLAQLIASREHHPQLRERRRATPAEATAAYETTARLVQ